MPERDARLLDIRTSPIGERIGAIDDFVATGYEMRLDFSPVVLRDVPAQVPGDLLRCS